MKCDDTVIDTLREIRQDLREIRENQIEQGFDIKANKDNLVEHMKRTELLEGRVESLEEKEIGKKYLWKVIANLGKVIGAISAAIGIIYSALKFLK